MDLANSVSAALLSAAADLNGNPHFHLHPGPRRHRDRFTRPLPVLRWRVC